MPPVQQSSSSAQRPDLAEFLARGFSAMGEPCPDLPCFYAPSSGRSRLREAGRCHWRLPGLSSAPAFPLHLGPRRPGQGLGAGGLTTAKGPGSESSVRGKGRASAGLLQRFLCRQGSAPHGQNQDPRPLTGVCSPAHQEADSLGAQQVHDRRRFPSTLLPSTDMCRWFGPDPACLGSRPQPQLRGSSP